MKVSAAPRAKPLLDRAEEMMARMGLPAGMGRLVGWLMIGEPACQTLDEIAQAVGAPVDTVRAQLDGLLKSETVERVQLPGRTGPCYALKPIDALLERRVRQIQELQGLVDEFLSVTGDESPEVKERLSGFRDVYARFERELRRELTHVSAESRRPPS